MVIAELTYTIDAETCRGRKIIFSAVCNLRCLEINKH